ncbi:HEAT repeat domain-containing protein [Flavilitoribacter nigricans]|uniref:HEAT repeat domain-containing protein n=1 Tax=Flavilitoribacter nigricans (strain ATCC 23147 / DSM 23189 / NBRC 102662 / NCIMB 1420 / SS-2) TaxID=1122177 RepID=A0A2D0N2A0_FLAN2|nr:HEAT repeat domain-containing protein [Flavilitoribacter nigricans]PHN02625.1 hypothetical protein CRP01_31010 [Flavilitoribacter nigricans DSM 23189 = NBRC 102662]
MQIHPIPEKFQTAFRFTREVNGTAFDFTGRCTVFGKVLEVNCHFLQLPEVAQRLITLHPIQEEMERIRRMIPLQIPLLAANFHWSEDGQGLLEQLTSLQQDPAFPTLDPEVHILEPWVRNCWLRAHYRTINGYHLAQKLVFREKEILTALREISGREAEVMVPVLIRLVEEGLPQELLEAAYRALGRCRTDESLDFLCSRLFDPSRLKEHPQIIDGLKRYRLPNQKRRIFRHFLTRWEVDDERIFPELSKLLRTIAPARWIRKLASGLDHPEEAVRRRTLMLLPHVAKPEHYPRLLRETESEDAVWRAAAFRSIRVLLQRYFIPNAVAPLIQRMEKADASLQAACIQTMKPALGKENYQYVIRPLLSALQHPAPEVRVAAIHALGVFRYEEIEEEIEKLKADPEPVVSQAARAVRNRQKANPKVIYEEGLSLFITFIYIFVMVLAVKGCLLASGSG